MSDQYVYFGVYDSEDLNYQRFSIGKANKAITCVKSGYKFQIQFFPENVLGNGAFLSECSIHHQLHFHHESAKYSSFCLNRCVHTIGLFQGPGRSRKDEFKYGQRIFSLTVSGPPAYAQWISEASHSGNHMYGDFIVSE